jgi:hypothetical protein
MAAPSDFFLKVLIGKESADKPIPFGLAAALASAEVNLSDKSPSGFQLVFNAQPSPDSNDYPLILEPLLAEFNRVVLKALVDGQETLLMDGYIIEKELDREAGKIVVTGEDLTVKMDLFEISKQYPDKVDSAMVTEILARYSFLGFTKKVTPPASEATPIKSCPQQLATDRDYLLELAKRNDSRFYAKFGTAGATVYWGPPERDGRPQPALSSQSGLLGNVEKLNPRYASTKGVLHFGAKLADGDGGKESMEKPFGAAKFADVLLSKLPVPLGKFASLATDPESFEKDLSTLKVKGKYMQNQQLNVSRVDGAAQSATDREGGEAATIDGELDTARYGHILQVPGIVGVRGAGKTFDGDYYVQSVTHKMNFRGGEAKYMQSFKLTREGVGSKLQAVATK